MPSSQLYAQTPSRTFCSLTFLTQPCLFPCCSSNARHILVTGPRYLLLLLPLPTLPLQIFVRYHLLSEAFPRYFENCNHLLSLIHSSFEVFLRGPTKETRDFLLIPLPFFHQQMICSMRAQWPRFLEKSDTQVTLNKSMLGT